MSDAIYECTGNVYRPLKWAGSPWSRTSQHGGPVNGLFAREAERVAADIGMQVARLTIDLFKAVPTIPLAAETILVREGRRIASLEITLHPLDADDPVSRATVQLLRPSAHEDDFWQTAESPPTPFDVTPQADRSSRDIPYELPPGFHQRVDIRAGVDDAGPFVWMATPLDLVTGESISPMQRATALTDMTLGSQMRMRAHRSGRQDWKGPRAPRLFMINTDTTVYWERPFQGKHLAMRPSLLTQNQGIGTAEAILYDAEGRVGRSIQSALAQGSLRQPDRAS